MGKTRLGKNSCASRDFARYLSSGKKVKDGKGKETVSEEEIKDCAAFLEGYFDEDDIKNQNIKYLYYITRNGKMFINKYGKYLWENKTNAILSYKATIRHSIMAFLNLTIPDDSDLIQQIFKENFADFQVNKIYV